VERKARKDGVGKRKAERGDMPRIVAGGLKMQSEGTSGENARLAGRRKQEASQAIAEARQRIEILQPFSAHVPSTGLPANKVVLRLDHVDVGYDGGPPVLSDVSFDLVGPERVAISGANGSGKTTLIRAITGGIAPSEGRVSVFTDYALLDQTISLLDAGATIRDNFRRLNPDADENSCRAALARFMFRADAALQLVSTLSGGQLLRAGLACVLGGTRPPPLLILDEPTNHLDRWSADWRLMTEPCLSSAMTRCFSMRSASRAYWNCPHERRFEAEEAASNAFQELTCSSSWHRR
jgi:ATPase subunit of ABC transporter with duplicated ATPase domains